MTFQRAVFLVGANRELVPLLGFGKPSLKSLASLPTVCEVRMSSLAILFWPTVAGPK